MTMAAPPCNKCGGMYSCRSCDQLLRKQLAAMHEVDHELMANVGALPDVRDFLAAVAARSPYAMSFPTGEHGGAMLDLGRGVILECLLPYVVQGTRKVLPFMPRPFDGCTIVHDLRETIVRPEDVAACKARRCDCDSKPTGWVLTRPILRAILNVSDPWLNDNGRLLPGVLPTWNLTVSTPTFMERFFDPDFSLPTRAVSRSVRAARARARRQGCAPLPLHRRSRRRD